MSATDSIAQAPPDGFDADMARMKVVAGWAYLYALLSPAKPAPLEAELCDDTAADMIELLFNLDTITFGFIADDIAEIGRVAA